VDRSSSDPLRIMRRDGRAHRRGRGRLARRRHRPLLDARVGESDLDPRGLRDRRGTRPHPRRLARPRVLGEVVPRRLGQRDARANPALVLLAALHVGRARRQGSFQTRPRLREDVRRERPRDARLMGQHDRGRGRLCANGRRRHALAVLPAAPHAGSLVRLRPWPRDQAEAAHALELRQVPDRLRKHRRVLAVLGDSGAGRRHAPSRPLARRADEATGQRSD